MLTAVIVAYDDSDGWYDHQMGPIVNQSPAFPSIKTNTTRVFCDSSSTLRSGPRSISYEVFPA